MTLDRTRQDRPTVAAIPLIRSLRARIALVAVAAIATVIAASTLIELSVFEGAVERELAETGRLTALAIADDLELREGTFTPETVTRRLHDFIDAIPDVHRAFVFAQGPDGTTPYAGSAPRASADMMAAARLSVERREMAWGPETGSLRSLAVPLERDGRLFGAVVLAVSFRSLDQLRTVGRTVAVGATLAGGIVLFLLFEWFARQMILHPIEAIQHTMLAAGEGRMSERAPVERPDEIGAIAAGLNSMLAQIDDLHSTLQQRVDEATSTLRERNRQLADLYHQLFTLREELGRAQQFAAVGETASVVAHQIGTPLNLVSGHIQVLMEEHGPASPVTQRLGIAQEQVRKVTDTVRGLLQRSRRRLVRERVDLAGLIRRICTLVQPAIESAGVVLALECPAAIPVEADAVQLEMALLNLISNAIDAMPGGGRLGIALRTTEGVVRVDVSDSGTGIPTELLPRIFEPWVTTKAEGRGTGLGLSITRGVIAEHGGSIRVGSSPGAGSVFTVELPLAPSPAAETPHHG